MYIFKVKELDINKEKRSSLVEPASQNDLVAIFSKTMCNQENSIWLAKMTKPHRLLQSLFEISPELSSYIDTEQQIIQLAPPGLDIYPNFLRVS